jgi:hypothetical protein
MLQGICPRCGAQFYGWALKSPEYQDCNRCGAWLDISQAPHENQGVSTTRINTYTPDNIRHILKETDIDQWLDS